MGARKPKDQYFARGTRTLFSIINISIEPKHRLLGECYPR